MSEEEVEQTKVPTSPLAAILFGLLIVLCGLGGFGTWATTAQLSSAVVTSGSLKVLSNRKKVQVAEPGVVRELMVKNGDRVTAGQVLVRLDDTRAKAALSVAQSGYDLSLATVTRLRAERDGLAEFKFPEELDNRTSVPTVYEIIEGQIQVYKARQKEMAGQKNMLVERIGQLEEEIIGLDAQSSSRERQIAIINTEVQDLKKLLEQGLIPRDRVLALEREAARLEGEKGESDAGIARARRLIAESELEGIQLKTTFDRSVRDELAVQETEMYRLQDRLIAARHAFERTEIKATENGYVVGLDVHTVGGVVEPAATLMEIVPAKDNLVIEAQVRPVDIDNVFLGQTADVNFSAFSQHEVPKLAGVVSYVSADVFSDPQTKTLYYTARITVTDEELARITQLKLLPGMPADVFMRTTDRTPISYLIQPLRQSFEKAWRES